MSAGMAMARIILCLLVLPGIAAYSSIITLVANSRVKGRGTMLAVIDLVIAGLVICYGMIVMNMVSGPSPY
jgi:uncharacterized membrane protein YjjB (DUF3815 family)